MNIVKQKKTKTETDQQEHVNSKTVSQIQISRPRVIKNTKSNEEIEYGSNFNKDFDFLNETQEKERLKLKGDSFKTIQQKTEKEKLNLINFIHFYKFISPIMLKTSHIEEIQLQTDYIYEHLSNSNKFALLFLEELNLSPLNPQYKWLINSFERYYMENYINNPNKKVEDIYFDLESEREKIKNLIKIAKQSLLEESFEPFEYEESDLNLKIQSSYLKNLNKINLVCSSFSFYLDQTNVLVQITKWLKEETKNWFLYKVKDNSLVQPKEKVILYQSLLNEVTNVLIEIWKKEANNFVSYLNNLNEEQREEWILNNPYNIDIVLNKTHDNLEKLFNLVSLVVSNK